MKKDCKQDYVIKVGNPPPKQSARLTMVGGHKPAKDDRVKYSYTDQPPEKKPKHKKLKAIIFGESTSEELDEGFFGNVLDAAKMLFGVSGGTLGEFSKHVDSKLAQKDIYKVKEILLKKLTEAEKLAIKNNQMSLDEIREYRRLITIYTIFGDKAETSKYISPELRPGAFEALQAIANKLFSSGGLEQRYSQAIDDAEEQLGMLQGEGRFEPYLRTYRRYSSYTPSMFRRRRTGRGEESSTERGGGRKPSVNLPGRTEAEKEAANKSRLITVLNSYILDNGLLFQAEQFLEGLVNLTTEPGKVTDYNRRLESTRRYIEELKGIEERVDTYDSRKLRAVLHRSLGKIRPAISRTRALKAQIKSAYSSDSRYQNILRIPLVWIDPETGKKFSEDSDVSDVVE